MAALYFESFDGNLDDWVAEGNAEISLNQGLLEVDATVLTLWCRKEFSGAQLGAQLVEYDVRLMASSIQTHERAARAANLADPLDLRQFPRQSNRRVRSGPEIGTAGASRCEPLGEGLSIGD